MAGRVRLCDTHSSGVVHAGTTTRGIPEGRPLRRGTRAAVRRLRRAQRAVRTWRQAARRRAGRRNRGARSAHDARTRPDGRATRFRAGDDPRPVRWSARRALYAHDVSAALGGETFPNSPGPRRLQRRPGARRPAERRSRTS